MANDIITINPLTTAKLPAFKNPKLNDFTRRIASIYADASKYVETKNRELASILAEVAETKSYEADGFKSVADYAETVFNIKKANAYALATAGKVYNDPKTPPALKAFTPSKVYELSAANPDAVKQALSDKTLSADMTQKDLREFAKKNPKDCKEKSEKTKVEVLPMYTARPCRNDIPDELIESLTIPHTLVEWEGMILAWMQDRSPTRTPECIKIPNAFVSPDAKKPTVTRRLFVSDIDSVVIEFYIHTAKNNSSKKPENPHFTIEELRKMLEEAEAASKDSKSK